MEPIDDVGTDLLPEVVEVEDVVVTEIAPPVPAVAVDDVIGDNDAVSVASEELEINLQNKIDAIPESVELSVEQRLAVWYSWLPPIQSDATEELGGNDSCLISAEGLILRYAAGAEYTSSFIDSPQFLKLVYHIEKFLADFIELGMVNLTLVFFDCFKGLLCRQHSSLWAFREAFRLHCKLSDRFTVLEFKNWSQPEYAAYIEERNPFLFILEDGGNLVPFKSIFAQDVDDEDDESDGANDEEASSVNDEKEKEGPALAENGLYGLYSLMLDTTCRGLNVSLLYQLEKNGRRVKTYVALPHQAVPRLNMETLPAVVEMLEQDSSLLEDHEAAEYPLALSQWPSMGNGKSLPVRLAIYRNCGLETGLKPDDDGEAEPWAVLFYKCLLIHDLLLRCTPLEERPTMIGQFVDSDSYALTLEFFMVKAQSLLSQLVNTSEAQSLRDAFIDCKREVADFFDERVLRSLLFCLVDHYRKDPSSIFDAAFFGINQEWQNVLETVWSQMCDNSQTLFPISLADIEDSDFNLLEAAPADILDPMPPLTAEAPAVLPVGSDFLTQILSLDKESSIPVATSIDQGQDEGRQLVTSFFEDQEKEARSYEGRELINANGEPEYPIFWQEGSTFDNAVFNVESNRKEEHLPKWIMKYTGEEKEKEIRKYKQRKLQQSRAYARNINKYFGGLDRLHLPIVLIGGKASQDHPWAVKDGTEKKIRTTEPDTTETTTQAAAAVRSPKKGDKEEKKVSKRAAEIIAKNQQKIAEKRAAKEEDMGVSLYSQMSHLFKKKVSKVRVFNEAFLELLLGTRNASDSTVLEDFAAIKSVLTLPINRIAFLTTLAEKVMDPLEHTWKRKAILESNQLGDMLKTIGLVFRFIQVSVDKHVAVMNASQVKVFQSLLLMLGFERSARATFDYWALQQWKQKIAATSSVVDNDEQDVSKKLVDKKGATKKGGKPGAGQGGGKHPKAASSSQNREKDRAALQRQKATYLKKLETEAYVSKFSRKFDFAVNPEHEAGFQVNYLGADMERTLGSCVDSRVSFLPDYWQERLIDTVDALESALVVAPTASGKTFAAYYAMDCVLRYDNESCVMFISPTRALGLQVEAEVIARFSGKTYPTGCKTVLVGNLLEDRNVNWNTCQILITVPTCADAILSSPAPAMREWRSRLKYAILDEIHCIGDEKQGKEWENLIQLLPCPFIALSATVGNESDFSAWLARAQSSVKDSKVHFIKHNERYADLQTLYYSSASHSLYNLNPLLCLDFERLKYGTLTSDFHLVPGDAVQAFDQLTRTLNEKALVADWDEDTKRDVKFFVTQFAPEQYFYHTRSITKKQYRMWLTTILTTIEKLANEGVITEEDFRALSQRVAATKPIGVGGPIPWWRDAQPLPSSKVDVSSESEEKELTLGEELGSNLRSDQYFNDPAEFLHLIRDLEDRRLMPALVFNFNRAFASRLFYRVASKLIDDHHNKFYGTPEAAAKTKLINKKRADEYKSILRLREQAEKWKTLSKEQREEQGIDEQTFAELTGPLPPAPTDVTEDHDPEFFLTDRRTYISSQEEYAEVIEMCRLDWLVKDRKVPHILMESLKRGLGLYHDALHREYRRAVELLFRMRYLRIVVSDVSLSMGVNMPCKSTVFAGDSALLTPLLYRQTSGRAGRRGFDSLGHVVFWEFPFKKIRRLLCSKLPVLSGGYSVKPSTAVSAMVASQVNEANILKEYLASCDGHVDKLDAATLRRIDDSRKNFKKVFAEPLYEMGAPDSIRKHLKDNIRVSLRFAVDLARRSGLLNADGSEEAFTRVALSVADDEPGNLFLVYAIMRGVLKDLVDKPKVVAAGDEGLDEALLRCLAFALKRREYTYSVVRRFELASLSPELRASLLPQSTPDNPYSPLMPPLPSSLEKLAIEFDQKVYNNAKERAQAMALLHPDYYADEGILPISDINFFETDHTLTTASSAFKQWWNKILISKEARRAMSPFVTINGVPLSRLSTVDDLVASLRGLIFIERKLVPQLALPEVSIRVPGEKAPRSLRLINSYAADVVVHRSLRSIIEYNDVPAAEAYFIIMGLRESMRRLNGALWAQLSQRSINMKPLTYAEKTCCGVAAVVHSLDRLFSQIRL